MNIVCFHNLTDENEYLSNWYASEFMIEGKTFSSMEQFMMHQRHSCLTTNKWQNKSWKQMTRL